MIQLLGISYYYSTGIRLGVRGSDCSKIYEWQDEQMEGKHKDCKRGIRLNMNSFDNVLRKVTPYLVTKRDGLEKPTINVDERAAVGKTIVYVHSSQYVRMQYKTYVCSYKYSCMYVCTYS